MWRDFYEDSSSEEVAGRIPWHAVDVVERKDRWVRERGIEAADQCPMEAITVYEGGAVIAP